MVQEFYIKTNATLPYLRMELINDGRCDYDKFYEAIQDADITFSMKDSETGLLKVSNAPVTPVLAQETGCEEKYILEYRWDKKDTRKPGIYEGWFVIKFRGVVSDEIGAGDLIVPIQEKLMIYVN
jgi:hypothetical protein